MALICLTMVSGSFATMPQGKVNQSTHQVAGINGNYPTHITGLTDYTIHMGENR